MTMYQGRSVERYCQYCNAPVINYHGNLPGLDCVNCSARYEYSGKYIEKSSEFQCPDLNATRGPDMWPCKH